MATSLYDLSVPTFLQTVSAVGGFLDRAARHCAETGPTRTTRERPPLPDMAPFHFQIEALTHHAVWGLEAVKTGVFAPPPLVGAMPFADLRAMVGQAVTALEAFTPDEVNSWSGKIWTLTLSAGRRGKCLHFELGPAEFAFTSETFLLSFSLPNFYFHAVTAYDILRTRGVPLGKRDYEGRLRTRPRPRHRPSRARRRRPRRPPPAASRPGRSPLPPVVRRTRAHPARGTLTKCPLAARRGVRPRTARR